MRVILLNGKEVSVIDNKLDLRERNIKEISEIVGLENIKNLKILDLRHNNISEIDGENLDPLINLEELRLENNKIEKIKNLSNLKKLRILKLSCNKEITKIEGLENLTEITSLDLSDTNILELNGLGTLTKLNELKIARTPLSRCKLIKELGGMSDNDEVVNSPKKWVAFCLGEFVKFKDSHYIIEDGELYLCGLGIENIEDIEGLDGLTNLKKLKLHGNKIKEIKCLKKLTNLELLWLSYNQIKDSNGLENLTKLKELSLNNNKIETIQGLTKLTKLKRLNFSNHEINNDFDFLNSKNEIYEIRNINHLEGLLELRLGNNKITEIKGMNKLVNLKILDLSGNNISEIEHINKLKKLKNLNLSNNQISKIKGISHLDNLITLNLKSNNISEIKELKNLTNLEELFLDDNQIDEIKGLDSLYNLRHFGIGKNKIPQNILAALKISAPNYQQDPRWFISYCILKPKIENLLLSKNEIIYIFKLVESHPILRKIHFLNIDYKRLRNILNLFEEYLEIQENDEKKPISIVSPKYLLKELNKLKLGNFYEYEKIPKYLKLHNEDSAKNLIVHIEKKRLKPFNYSIDKGGIKINKIKGNFFKKITEHLKETEILEQETEDIQTKTWILLLNHIALLSEQSFNKKNSFQEEALFWIKEKKMQEWFDLRFRALEKEHEFIIYHSEADAGGGECEHFINDIPIEDKIVDKSENKNISEFLEEQYEKHYPQVRRYAIGKHSKYAILLITDKREEIRNDTIRASSPNKCLLFQYNEDDEIWCAVFVFQVFQKSPSQVRT